MRLFFFYIFTTGKHKKTMIFHLSFIRLINDFITFY